MSVTVELPSPSPCASPGYEKTFEDFCAELLQFDPTLPSSPLLTVNASVGYDETCEQNLLYDIQQWALPLSPRLYVSDVQSPKSFRPYGTPLANTSSATQPEDYFNHAPQDPHIHPESSLQLEHTVSAESDFSYYQFTHSPARYTDTSQEAAPVVSAETCSTSSGILHQRKLSVRSEAQVQKRKLSFNADDVVRIKSYGDAAGESAGVVVEWGRQRRGRGKMEEASRASYCVNRKFKACERCKKGRRKCGRSGFPYIECLTSKPLVFRDTPTAIRLFRSGPTSGHPLFSEKTELYKLEDLSLSPYVSLHTISQGVGHFALPIQVTRFDPHPELKVARRYLGSTGMKTFEMPRLCLANVRGTTEAVRAYVEQSWCFYLGAIMLAADPITQSVLREAIQYTTNRRNRETCLVQRALKLLALSRMIELSWTFSDQNVAGIDVIEDEDCPWHKKRPVTPVIDTQLDQIVIQRFLTPLRSTLLDDLSEKLVEGRRQDGFEVFLTTFILQTHTALLLRHSRKNAIQCGAVQRYNSLPLAEEYLHGSNILLAHFIHGRKDVAAILQGKTDTVAVHESHERFLRRLASSVHSQRDAFMKLRVDKCYETDMYWSHQMFFEGWVPEARSITCA